MSAHCQLEKLDRGTRSVGGKRHVSYLAEEFPFRVLLVVQALRSSRHRDFSYPTQDPTNRKCFGGEKAMSVVGP